MTWHDGEDDVEFDDSEDAVEDEHDLEEIDESEWEDIEPDIIEELDDHIVESSDGKMLHHFDFIEDAIDYARGAPSGVLTVVIDDEGGADVYRENYEDAA